MAIINRDLGTSQKQETWQCQVDPTITGQTYALAILPFPAELTAATQSAVGLSGAPNHSLWIQRFVAGSGVTSINIGASLVTGAFGTSGGQSFTISGYSNLLQTGDLILLSTAASNTATLQTTVTLVVKALQDIKTYFTNV